VEYKGRVAGLGAGTGAAFALLPAQNATGNWIKVVQRVPVRVEIDAKDLAAHPLRVGLSMQATVDVAEQQGQPLTAAAAAPRSSSSTDVFKAAGDQADKRVKQIIGTQLGRALRG
jgi:membrane fusion protein (multidrug efflux system)